MVASYNKKQGVAHVHHVQGAALAQWRASIRLAAQQAGAYITPLPVAITITFGMPRPKSHLMLRGGKYVVKWQDKDKRPAVAPDLDKLTRAVMDALSGVCYKDDAQVVSLHVEKVYADVTTIEAASLGSQDAVGLGTQTSLGLSEG